MANFSVYDKLDNLDITKLTASVKKMEWPKGKRYAVNCNGVEIKVQTYLAKAGEKMPDFGYAEEFFQRKNNPQYPGSGNYESKPSHRRY